LGCQNGDETFRSKVAAENPQALDTFHAFFYYIVHMDSPRQLGVKGNTQNPHVA
jgi:hypothetical protein